MPEMETIVLFPSPGMGHLVSMVELGKFILHHHPSFSVNILIVPAPFNTGSTASYIRKISAAFPHIHFHELPSTPIEPDSVHGPESATFELLRLSIPNVRHSLQSLYLTTSVAVFIIDFFCTAALSVGKELNIPTYFFITSGAGCLAVISYLSILHRKYDKSFKDMNGTILEIPGVPPLLASDMFMPVMDRETLDYKFFLNVSVETPEIDGIMINTFESLEPRSLKALREGACCPESRPPPVYSVGQLLADGKLNGSEDTQGCLQWLDQQPRKSVIFLSFGSLGRFSVEQVKEMADGLEKSGHRFLWVVRSPPTEDKTKRFLPPPEPDMDELLPTRFLDRTKDRGLVLKSWAPQLAVLSHDSVGGFVTHCGWNSTLEALAMGVPLIAWPLYAEQRFNRVVLVDLGLALPMRESADGFVAAEEVERRVKELMDEESEKGKALREMAEKKREEARAAVSEGGSSLAALAELTQLWKTSRKHQNGE